METIEKMAAKKATELGWDLLETTKLPHPDDSYLIYTVVKRKNDYATHLFNGELNYFAYGHYDIPTLDKAISDMKVRAR